MSKVDVSVIIPTYNRENILMPTISLLLNQQGVSGINYEIVIVDSGNDSTETTLKDNFTDSRICYKKFASMKNRSFLRNMGADIANGEVLIFLDNDMMVTPEFIESHYNGHKDKKNIVLLGKRKSLCEFDLTILPKEVVSSNSDMLEFLPHYKDVRDPFLVDINKDVSECETPWMFLYSHNFSLSKNMFDKVNGFDLDFGESWGYEDLELGYRLFIKGAEFHVDENIIAYHQPHLEQSKTEQFYALTNQKLFYVLHPCFEVELYVSLYETFDIHYQNIRSIKASQNGSIHNYDKDFKIILGCIIDQYECLDRDKHLNQYLGSFLPFIRSKSYDKVLICKTLFQFLDDLRILIISEALRISDEVWIENTLLTQIDLLYKDCMIAGNNVAIEVNEDYVVIKKKSDCLPQIYSCWLPPVPLFEQRFIYLKLIYEAIKSGHKIIMMDLKGNEDLYGDDYGLMDDEIALLKRCFRKFYGHFNVRQIYSTKLDGMLDNSVVSDSERSIVIIDDQFEMKYDILYDNVFSKSKCIKRSCIEKQLIHFVSEYIDNFKKKNVSLERSKIYSCFMENGFYEDGIDLILEAFNRSKSKDPAIKLCIKVPDVEKGLNSNFPMHNNSSRHGKNWEDYKKQRKEILLLMKSIQSTINGNDIILEKRNVNIEGILAIIDSCDTLICAARFTTTPIEVYAAILLRKKVLIPSHLQIDEDMKKMTVSILSTKNEYCNDMKVLKDSLNINLLSNSIIVDDLVNKLTQFDEKLVDDSIITKVINKINSEGNGNPIFK